MNQLIADFPQNMEDALKIASNVTLKSPKNPIHSILICGMGGSGIGGKMVSFWVQDEIKVPIQCLSDYIAPAYVNENTLVIASSYSGNTEETLIAVDQAHKKGAQIIGVCSGGELEAFCNRNNYDCVVVPGGNPPRTALAFSVVQVLNFLYKLDLINDKPLKDIAASRELILNNLDEIKAKANELASFVGGKVPIFYSEGKYEAIAIRARQQFNENSKVIGWASPIPEMNHNELVGWGGGDTRFAPVFFTTGDLFPKNQKRMDITIETIAKKTSTFQLTPKGTNFIERSFYLISVVDWASLYHAEMNNVDPIEIVIIDYLKSELANFN
jgi:glucose/mannose-6-phosphate isomerase